MPGAIFQINLKGPQDLFLTGNPEHNFIKQVYKRHVNFAIQKNAIKFKNQVDFGKNIEINIPREGDFLYKMYFRFKLPALVKTSGTYAGWTNAIGHAIIEFVELSIGGCVVDRQYGLFLEIWNELTERSSINNGDYLLTGKYNHSESLETNAINESEYEVPLKFWFCQNIASALPLISLQFHPVTLKFKLRKFDECIVFDGVTSPTPVSIIDASILAEFIYIEDAERVKYASKEHTYLINQTQSIIGESVNLNTGGLHRAFLNFNHPCSEMMFVLSEQDSQDNNDWFNFAQRNTVVATPIIPLLDKARLLLDGNERTEFLNEFTLRISNTYRYHTLSSNKHIYVISFSNEPEKFYPTGTLNFSLIDQAELQLQMKTNISSSVKLYVFVRNFNIIHIKKGMFSLGFST